MKYRIAFCGTFNQFRVFVHSANLVMDYSHFIASSPFTEYVLVTQVERVAGQIFHDLIVLPDAPRSVVNEVILRVARRATDPPKF